MNIGLVPTARIIADKGLTLLEDLVMANQNARIRLPAIVLGESVSSPLE